MNSIRFKANVVAMSGMGVALLFFWFPPGQYRFYPRCPIFALTGWECPGCGATRALAALLRGHVVEAWHYNSLFVFLTPVLVAFFAMTYWKAMREGRFGWPEVPLPFLKMLLCVTVAFGLVRNLYGF